LHLELLFKVWQLLLGCGSCTFSFGGYSHALAAVLLAFAALLLALTAVNFALAASLLTLAAAF
jgi:hypothetical protein